VPYVDLNTIHNPATGTVAPATWGDQIRDNCEFLVDVPACSVFSTTNPSITHDTPTILAANSENYDNDAMHSTVTNNSRITCQTAGRYLLTAVLVYAANNSGNRGFNFVVNGTTTLNMTLWPASSSGALTTNQSGCRSLVMAAGDYVEVEAYQSSGVGLIIQLREFVAVFLTR
jgi:hypothetical protein